MLREFLQDLVGRIATIQDEHVAALEAREHLEEVLSLARSEWRDNDVDRRLRAHVEQDAREHLRTVGALGNTECLLEIVAALQVDLRAVDGEDSLAMPALRFERRIEGGRGDLVQYVAQQFGSDLVSRRAERRRRYRVFSRQLQPVTAGLVPEAAEQVLVAPTIPVGDHVQQQRREQLGSERPLAREVARVAAKATVIRSREHTRNY